MGSLPHSVDNYWADFEVNISDQQVLFNPAYNPPLPFLQDDDHHLSLCFCEDYFSWPDIETFLNDPVLSSSTLPPPYFLDWEEGHKETAAIVATDGVAAAAAGKKPGSSRHHHRGGSSAQTLSRETISKYFNVPISRAAKEMNVGLTHLKRRCRMLGIRRWPHRKLASLQTLIHNVQELVGKDEDEEGDQVAVGREAAVEVLEMERRRMEENPDMELDETTKRLRQACFKANYKRRRLMQDFNLLA